jgi:hypothetical protein
MIERKQDRRGPRSWPVPGDRRATNSEKPAPLDWSGTVPAIPGTIRPGHDEVAPLRERRQRPESGME